jgi:predicted peptidase
MLARIATLLAATGILFMASSVSAVDHRDRYEGRVFTGADGSELPYRLLVPKAGEKGKKYPLVIFLHGAGERGTDNKVQLVHAMNEFASDVVMEKYPAIVIAPQCGDGEQWVNVPWTDDRHTMPEKPSKYLDLTLQLIDSHIKNLNVDTSRIYITGLSMGGFGTWDAVQRRPDFFAAAVPVCGGGDMNEAKKIAHVPIWAFHGDEDGVVKPGRSRDMVAALEAAGGKPRYTEFITTGHDSWVQTYRNPEMYEWLFSQKKK